jgi:hypothetical protein
MLACEAMKKHASETPEFKAMMAKVTEKLAKEGKSQ